jgi:hypothetical protein
VFGHGGKGAITDQAMPSSKSASIGLPAGVAGDLAVPMSSVVAPSPSFPAPAIFCLPVADIGSVKPFVERRVSPQPSVTGLYVGN